MNKLTGNAISLNLDKEKLAKILIVSALVFLIADTLYMNIAGIAYGNKELCILYKILPRWAFFIYEYFIELLIIVLLGLFGGVLIEQYSYKIKRFFPSNQVLAFFYASILPICSCGVIPVVESMKKRVSIKTIVTFILAAPLLNPYIVFMSISVLGIKYAILRIIAAFILAVSSGIIVEFVVKLFQLEIPGIYENCSTGCETNRKNPYLKTMVYLKKLLPYIMIAALLTFIFEYIQPQKYLETLSFSNESFAVVLMMLIGIPIYVCNGADVLFLKPLLTYTDLSITGALTFSLTSSAICISSIVILVKFFGKRITIALIFALIATILIGAFLLSFMINIF